MERTRTLGQPELLISVVPRQNPLVRICLSRLNTLTVSEHFSVPDIRLTWELP